MKNDLRAKRIHFIGVGGISMSALARWCKAAGSEVSGSDKAHGKLLDILCDEGIYAYSGLNPAVATKADIVVYSSAIDPTNIELVAAKNSNIPVYERHVFLGKLADNFNTVIAIAGTHGKTTVTSLIASVMKKNNLPFTAHVGGEAPDIGGNFYSAGNEMLVTEACEYRKNFLSLNPNLAVVLNVESDHPDCFNDIGDLYDAFAEFVGKLRNNGFIVVYDKVECSNLHICDNAHIIKFGLNIGSDVRADNIVEQNGVCEYDLIINQEYIYRIRPKLIGRHNVINVLAAAAVCHLLGLDMEVFKNTVENFGGVKRRFEKKGEINGAEIIVDYAHHPSEIIASIAAAKARAEGQVRVYFQPHTFSRTAKYFAEFSLSFSGADEVNFLPTYPARETPDMGRSSFELFYYVNTRVRDAKYYENFVDAATNIIKTARPKDLILILGAGDVNEMAELLI